MIPLIPIAQGLISIAPSIAKWFGGDKAEDAAQSVVDIARQVTGQNDAGQAVDLVKANPELQAKFLMLLEQNRTTIELAIIGDIQHAREAHKHSYMPAILSSVLTVALISFIACLFFVAVPEGNQRIVDILFGSFLTAWLQSIAYWYGTTRGSADKSKGMIK